MPDITPRESVWSVPQSWQGLYLVLFTVQFFACAGVVTWYQVASNTEDSAVETFFAIGQVMAALVIMIVAHTLIIVEVIVMLSERYLARRFEQGRARGRAEGRTAVLAELREWERRRQEAKEKGEPFDEPLPTINLEGGPNGRK